LEPLVVIQLNEHILLTVEKIPVQPVLDLLRRDVIESSDLIVLELERL